VLTIVQASAVYIQVLYQPHESLLFLRCGTVLVCFYKELAFKELSMVDTIFRQMRISWECIKWNWPINISSFFQSDYKNPFRMTLCVCRCHWSVISKYSNPPVYGLSVCVFLLIQASCFCKLLVVPSMPSWLLSVPESSQMCRTSQHRCVEGAVL
jgi:hypothetical protein